MEGRRSVLVVCGWWLGGQWWWEEVCGIFRTDGRGEFRPHRPHQPHTSRPRTPLVVRVCSAGPGTHTRALPRDTSLARLARPRHRTLSPCYRSPTCDDRPNGQPESGRVVVLALPQSPAPAALLMPGAPGSAEELEQPLRRGSSASKPNCRLSMAGGAVNDKCPRNLRTASNKVSRECTTSF